MKLLSLLVTFTLTFSAGCVHNADLRSSDQYGTSESKNSSGPVNNSMDSQIRRYSLKQSCLDRVGDVPNAEEICNRSVQRSEPGRYVVTPQWTVEPTTR